MPVRTRLALPLALALTGASLAVAPTAHAQQRSALAADSLSASQPSQPAQPVAAPATPAGPTMEAASVAVRHAPVTEAAPARRAGYGQPVALMVVGGAAVLVGLIIGGGAGTALAVGGVVIGLYGLYEFLQ
jgi:hypothetical protein